MKERQAQKNKIINVYQSNFIQEMKNISDNLKQFPYIGMDTEFPGTLYSPDLTSYQAIKQNVDNLKLIQVGITLSDKQGNRPLTGGIWQFNLKFSLKSDKYAKDSITMLTNCGIDFELLEHNGIEHDQFAEYLLSSGLVLNDELKWVCFHGIYDFAYLLKTLTNLPLPDNEKDFFTDLSMYFPTFYDIRYLIRYNDNLKGSLTRLAQELNVKRFGIQHQAGSDSLITLEVFLKLFVDDIITVENAIKDKNALFGISPTEPANSDSEYNQFMINFGIGQGSNEEHNDVNNYSPNLYSNSIYEYNQSYYGNIPYQYMRGNNSNYYYPYQMMNRKEESKENFGKRKWNRGEE